MNILIGFEYSGILRDAFIRAGHNAWSCDVIDGEGHYVNHHIKGDIRNLFKGSGYELKPGFIIWPEYWHMLILHPPCTYLANSGVRWLHTQRGRKDKMKAAAELFLWCMNLPCQKIAIENPVMHKHAVGLIGRKQSFCVQPWQFGDNFKKRTCWWVKGLPELIPTSSLDGTTAVPECHNMGPSPLRGKLRSKTYPGMANAIVSQWS